MSAKRYGPWVAAILVASWAAGCKDRSKAKPAAEPPSAETPSAPEPRSGPDPAEAKPAAPKTPEPKRARPAPKPDPKLNAEQRSAYRAALRDGRKAHRAGDFPASIAAFDRALEIFTDDPRALNERGWARYKSGDLDGAEADTRRALERTVDAKLLGASWYNLGRIHADRGETDAAARAWRTSLAARPHPVVRDRLAKIDPAAASPLTAASMAGPFADDAALCAYLKEETDITNGGCLLKGTAEPNVPFGARLVRTYASIFEGMEPDPESPGVELWHLVLDVPKGRFVLSGVASAYNPGAFGIYEETEVAGPLTWTLPDDSPVVWIEAGSERGDSDMGLNEVESASYHAVFACGLGASGVPSCVGPLPTKVASVRELLHDEDPEPNMEHDLWSRRGAFSVELLESGSLAVEAVGEVSKGIDQSHVGVHRLVFP